MNPNTSKRGKRGKAVTLREEGYTYEEIAKRLGDGATKSGVRKLCIRIANTGSTKSAARTGRKSKVTKQDVRRICRLALQDRRRSAKDINNIMRTSGVQDPKKEAVSEPDAEEKTYHLSSGTQDWVIWNDETKISIFGSDGVKFVQRQHGEDLLPECTMATMKHPVGGVGWLAGKTRKDMIRKETTIQQGQLRWMEQMQRICRQSLMKKVHEMREIEKKNMGRHGKRK
ncbi:hypothetical protein ILUMI_09341 [Ignelater luminosus]|uniref:Uncharacterized protein n=1 Tax=Ignelater luminosus TaxID=2038154 RepID=A0A8K0D418_IGNLU|nr:hypothetical protein ILUMI_09341 [Ignelater luminosus]